jgi:hypothetical protein
MNVTSARSSLAETGRRDPAAALHNFVASARELLPYRAAEWNAASWNIDGENVKKRAHLRNNKSLLFTPHYAARCLIADRIVFETAFADLVKACIVKRRLDRGMEAGPQMVFLRAARYLYDAISFPVRWDPTLISRGDFVAAETAILLREKPSSAYRACVHLQELATMLDRHGLCRARIEFSTSAKRPRDERDRTSAAFEDRAANLPTAAALAALAGLANDDRLLGDVHDRLCMRITELLFVCGFRAGEVLTLPADPVVREYVLDGGVPRLDARTGQPVERIGLRYTPEKGGEPIVKWVPTEAAPLILRSVRDIDEICGPARKNARWLEAHPGDVQIDVEHDELLSMAQAGKIVGLNGKGAFISWIKQRDRGGRNVLIARGKAFFIRGSDLRRAMASDRFDKPVLVRQNGKTQSLGDSLIVIPLWFFHKGITANFAISMPMSLGTLRDFLAGREGMPSVLGRFGVLDEQGQPFRFRSHDFRRLVNIIAQRGGLSQVEIAQWMGRRRVEDNGAYDLRSATELADEMRALIAKNEVFGSIADQVGALPVIERADFLNQRLTMLHTTPHGQCGSNIVENPCETAVSCLGGCRHYLRKKNDPVSRASLLRIERETLLAIERASAAGDVGQAKNWLENQERVLRTTRAALAIDDDPNLADGEVCQVNPGGPNIGVPL